MPKPIPKYPISIEKFIDHELKFLEKWDPSAWHQLGGYLVECRKKINEFVGDNSKTKTLDQLCGSLAKIDTEFVDYIEPRVLRFILFARKNIGDKIRSKRARMEKLKVHNPNWPKPKKHPKKLNLVKEDGEYDEDVLFDLLIKKK